MGATEKADVLHAATEKADDVGKSGYPSLSLWHEAVAHTRYAPVAPSRPLPTCAAADAITHYGQHFVWSAQHLSSAQLEPLRLLGDEPMDTLLDELDLKPRDDVLAALQRDAAARPGCGAARFLDDVSRVPEWVDWSKIHRGQGVFQRYLMPASVVLYNMSLVAGFSLPKVTKVLEQSGYLVGSPAHAMRRLFETGLLLVDSCATDEALTPGGAGWKAALRVRALHAKVRRRLLRRGRGDSAAAAADTAADTAAAATAHRQLQQQR